MKADYDIKVELDPNTKGRMLITVTLPPGKVPVYDENGEVVAIVDAPKFMVKVCEVAR
jgi:hypothetical protein